MKCFLHIGTEKTATTTLQNFFDINRNRLLKKGFIYTKAAGNSNNRQLPVAAYDLHRRDDFTKGIGLDTEDKLASFQRKTIDSLTEEIELIKKGNPKTTTIIFSSEHIQSRLTNIKELERLKYILLNFGINDISVIVYLRRPAEIANSLYSTAIKAGSCEDTPPLPMNPYWNNVCNHRQTIEKFGSIFGKAAIIPRLFDKNHFVNGSVIDDVLNVIGIPNDNYVIPNNANGSLSLTGVNILRRLNKTVPVWVGNKPNQVRANLVSYIQKHLSENKYIMPGNLYEAYDLEFQKSNEWVRLQYFPDKKVLFSSEIPKESNLNIPDSELDRIVDLITNIWIDKERKILDLTNKATSAECV
ncbi:MAG: hypothetical protein PHI97_12290 [Desulfobulbus sp.]|nr:hypothetical protein [Desulfobulbus sp.]